MSSDDFFEISVYNFKKNFRLMINLLILDFLS